MRLLLSLLVASLIISHCCAQSISGTLADSKTKEPIPFANVFVNGTSLGTVTDLQGHFLLQSNLRGTYELVMSFVGYESIKLQIQINQARINLGAILMTESSQELNSINVVSKKDKEWPKQLKKFKAIFLGSDKFAESCSLLNPWVLDFSIDSTGKFIAKSNESIQIKNDALGYKVTYHLKKFWSTKLDYQIDGHIQFEELNPNTPEQLAGWRRNRNSAFQRSYNYLFKSLLNQNLRGAGFSLQTKALSDNAVANNYGIETWLPFDTTGLVSKGNYGEIEIQLKNLTRVIYTKGKNSYSGFLKSGTGIVKLNKNGFVLNPDDLTVYGDLTSNRLAVLLPTDYEPTHEVPIDHDTPLSPETFLEQVYVQLDKPYYYPGEVVWFKGYIKYGNPAARDSLSKVAYVELISPTRHLLQAKTVTIAEGGFHNDFQLPDSLTSGIYYLRAYTQANRNFGDDQLYTRSLPILRITEKASPSPSNTEDIPDSLIDVKFDKSLYKTRGKVKLTIKLREQGVSQSANLSIGVTDCFQVAQPDEAHNIKEKWNQSLSIPGQFKLDHHIEYGLTYQGQFLNEGKKPEKLPLHFMEPKSRHLYLTESNALGQFNLSIPDFFDSTLFIVTTSKTAKDRYGNITMKQRLSPPMLFETSAMTLPTTNTDSPQRLLAQTGLPADAINLEEVVVKGRRIVQNNKPIRSYGLPDQVINSNDINQNNILYSLMKIPGIMVDIATNTVVFTRAATQSINFGRTPLVTIDDVPMGGLSAGEILSMLNPATIETIEVTKRLNPLYGSQGANGVIAIYLKHDAFDAIPVSPNYQMVTLQGFSTPHQFASPDYDQVRGDGADYRSTIYWNPQITFDNNNEAQISFSAADLPGKYKVAIEGVSSRGQAIHAVYYIKIEDE